MVEIPEGYCIPTSVVVWSGKVQEQDVVVLDLEVVVPGHNMEPQRAVLVLLPEDAAVVAADMLAAAGEEN